MDQKTVEAVRKLLGAGHTHRDAARLLGIGKTTVGRIARGEIDGTESAPRSARCPGCGRKLQRTPCLQCGIEAAAQVRRDLRALSRLETDR